MALTPGHRELTENERIRISTIKDAANDLLEILDLQGQSRELSLAKTKVEEAVMWAVKGIAG